MWAKHKQPGFTIVELLIVVVVIGILAAITIVAYSGIQTRARDSKRVSDIQAIKQLIEAYNVDNGVYPPCDYTTADQCGTLLSTISAALVPKYTAALPTDPSSSGTKNYYYARGWKKNGITHTSTLSPKDYSIGTELEATGGPYSGSWGANINYMEGNQ